MARCLSVVHGEEILGANLFRDRFSAMRSVIGIDLDRDVIDETNDMMSVAVSGPAQTMS